MAIDYHITQRDITTLSVDAIVNAANPQLAGGGGVDGAIHRVAGPELSAACRAIMVGRGYALEPGEAELTEGFGLAPAHIIHAVGPMWQGGDKGEDQALASAYRKSLALAVTRGFQTIAFPNISTGVYGFPKERAAQIVLRVFEAEAFRLRAIKTVYFACFDQENYDIYAGLFGGSQFL